ncbi:MAG: Qat anti-phage system associated protein QatB [Undibacterium sp.]|uniref:Qat anti-phage system associated protein QatB n=1 Tax=Undibacterium sp. TaxID=1914977 RepID=UPI00271FFE6E|nr:Qat anti-phage system associated protein QatB [Undibacterium sp.]MDO8653485.1 Qat anti-phage system associated protein QatB [Undibacterium sp.]
MGTSTSSTGASAGVPFDPAWLNDVEEVGETETADMQLNPSEESGQENTDSVEEISGDEPETADDSPVDVSAAEIAPPARYSEARRQLTRFVNTGDHDALRGAISSLVNKGMGGSAKAASRMRTTASAASALGGFLKAARDGTSLTIAAWVASAKERGLRGSDIALEVVNQLLPLGGSIDEESAKHAMTQAIAYLYEVEPTIDLFKLGDDQIACLMAYTVAFDVYHRVQLELGRVFEKLKYSALLIHERLNQALDYVIAVVSAEMIKARGTQSTSMRTIANNALRNTLNVFGAP